MNRRPPFPNPKCVNCEIVSLLDRVGVYLMKGSLHGIRRGPFYTYLYCTVLLYISPRFIAFSSSKFLHGKNFPRAFFSLSLCVRAQLLPSTQTTGIVANFLLIHLRRWGGWRRRRRNFFFLALSRQQEVGARGMNKSDIHHLGVLPPPHVSALRTSSECRRRDLKVTKWEAPLYYGL